jgi:lipopolysaccharide transport system ATP-binding protein
MKPVIEIRGISKRYKLGEHSRPYFSLREELSRGFGKLWKIKHSLCGNSYASNGHNSFWAVRDVSFDVYEGETVAIIGSNGAGKSTLLKIISRITDPTTGYIKARGRMGSLLEVGTGFHPELTGRENIFLNGIILGMRKAQIESKFDEIVSFAGLGGFLDTPVKRYSSGMYVRLAFSVAAHLDPEILIVDEVLAVGDVAFQKKCLGKMAEACSRSKTVLFVSHNLAAVESLCGRGIVLERGRVAFDGSSREAVQFYLESLHGNGAASHAHVIDLGSSPGRPGKYRPQLRKLELFDGKNRPLRGSLPAGGSLRAQIYVELETACANFDAELAFYTLSGQRVCTAHSAYEPCRIHEPCEGQQVFACEIASLPLVPGEYKINVGLDIALSEVDCVEDAARLTVINSDYYGTGIVPTKGVFLLNNRWTLEKAREEILS